MNAIQPMAVRACRQLHLAPLRLASRSCDAGALESAAAARRARVEALHDAMEQACEAAALRCRSRSPPECWSRRAWRRYLAEAVHQARRHGPELKSLRRELSRLEDLIQILGRGRCPHPHRPGRPTRLPSAALSPAENTP